MSALSRHQLATLEFAMVRHEAEAVTCPYCHAIGRADLPPNADGSEPDGQPCRNPITGQPHRGPAHWQRIHLAKETP